MITYPLKSLSIEEAIAVQFKLVDQITKEFDGYDILTNGDLGVHPKGNQPQTTRRVEKILANFFGAEDACFVRGSGTGAIREGLSSFELGSKKMLVHKSPIYSTTITSMDHLCIETVSCNFNNIDELTKKLQEDDSIGGVLIQYTRQSLDDSYDMETVINTIKNFADLPILTDDNYAVMKVKSIGSELGADLSAFSMFKLLGPEGIGCVVGKSKYVEKIRSYHYSGGSQIQGFEAMDVIRSLVYAPVALAVQATQIEKIAKALQEGAVSGVKNAVIANAQSKVILVELEKPIAEKVLKHTSELGGAAYPVGAESKYEIAPMFYRVSGTMLAGNDDFKNYWIRINPMRSGSDTVLRILEEAIKRVV